VILVLIFVMYCTPGANQSVYRAYACPTGGVSVSSVEIMALWTVMAALVMLNVLDFGNCGHIVIIATCGQTAGANQR
jgi:hypothetical protein